MDKLIERYVYDVSRRLPEKDRDEVSKELKANIYDMLSDHAGESELKEVLYKLGSPASLAEQYRQNPQYLISPAIYGDYVRVLKWILPLVGGIVLIIGMILGAIDALQDGMVHVPHVISNTLSRGISMGVSAAFGALVWTTVGFVIAERTGVKTGEGKEEWKIEDLPEILPNKKGRIQLSDSITELVLTVVFSVVAILACSGILPIVFIFQDGTTIVRTLFSSSFLASCIPALAVMALLGICECIVKIKERRWTPSVCFFVITNNIVCMGISVYLLHRSDLFSTEFTSFLQSKQWGSFDLLRFAGTGGTHPVITCISILVVLGSLAGCGHAICKTLKHKNP